MSKAVLGILKHASGEQEVFFRRHRVCALSSVVAIRESWALATVQKHIPRSPGHVACVARAFPATGCQFLGYEVTVSLVRGRHRAMSYVFSAL